MSYDAQFLLDVALALEKHRSLAERALEQLDDQEFFAPLGPEGNSPAIQVKHLSGSTRSRFTDFLTTDGEKPDRGRDGEFDTSADSREELMNAWQGSWTLMLDTIKGLTAEDLGRAVTIRAEPHSVPVALLRALTHAAYHTGQIVQQAKHQCGDRWQTLSVPKGESEAFTAEMRRRFSSDSDHST